MTAGNQMAAEIAEAPDAFLRAVRQDAPPLPSGWRGAYTIARGSSDAAALILAYEIMREAGRPVTSLPPSVFSIGQGVALDDALILLVSQSGASEDLIRSAQGARARGGHVVAITNVPGSPVEAEAQACLPIGAGPELAVPATKTVVGAVGAGLALLSSLVPSYAARAQASAEVVARLGGQAHPHLTSLRHALESAQSVYVIGRDTGFGAAQEIALKLKECCALHAEAYSASEVLHGPLQLATEGLTVLLLDTGAPGTADSLDVAEQRLADQDAVVHRVSPADVGATDLTPAAAAALLLCLLYPVVHATALARGHDPDAPETLSKVTRTT
ncbi:SIS domain-containing protein [Rubellimicrobium arenae]|uniref:SIS domain-containing protein n=1 Tax=Rubellimicrobium arenae TaxID=2817372 RepID=UPI001B3044BC|nr:SIS domain-containing protein [Rubellimicrobium arenae]